ncbi:unnamed protein product, partial [Cladocopium goreaui]
GVTQSPAEPSEMAFPPVEAPQEVPEPKGPLPDGSPEGSQPSQPSVESLAATAKSLENSKALGNVIVHGPPDSADGAASKKAVADPADGPETVAEAAPAPATAPEGPPDRTLELAGLEALLKNHDARLQIQSQEELKRAHE